LKLTKRELLILIPALRPQAPKYLSLVENFEQFLEQIIIRRFSGNWKGAIEAEVRKVFPGSPTSYPAMAWTEVEHIPDAMSCPSSHEVIYSLSLANLGIKLDD
jgi:hypothetical protein